MSTTQPDAIFETDQNHLKPFLAAVGIFVASVVASLLIVGLPHF